MLDQLQREQTVVHSGEVRTVHLDRINLDAVLVEFIVEAQQQVIGLLEQEVAAIDEVDTQNAYRGVLQQGIRFVEAGMQDDGVGLLVGPRLEAHAEPSMTFYGLVVIDGRHGIRKGKKPLRRVLFAGQPVLAQAELVVEHFLDPRLANVAA